MAVNYHKVPKMQWAKWSRHAQLVFNKVHHDMRDQSVMKHPDAPGLKQKHWNTVRYNAAWTAASAVEFAIL